MPKYLVRASNAKNSPKKGTNSKPEAERIQARMKNAGYKDAHIEEVSHANRDYWFTRPTKDN